MNIQEISFRNIASYGGQLQRLSFEKKESFLYLVLGGNGFGKSTIAKAIIYALYGQIDELTLADLPNRINKNLYVKIKLKCNNKNIVIERGLAPKLFKVEIDGVSLDQAGIGNVQDYLENEVFEMPYRVFKNVIILSINDFKSFLTMTPKDKRLIIDKLFGFSAINDMFNLIKKERKELNDDLNSVKNQLISISQSISTTVNKLQELEKISTEENKKKIQELKDSLLNLKSNYDKLVEAKEKLEISLGEINKDIDNCNLLINTKKNNYTNAQRKLQLYENECCTECGKELDTDFDIKRKEKYENIINEEETQILELELKLNDLKELSSSNSKNQNAVIGRISSINVNIENLKKELINIANFSKNGKSEFNQLNSLISEFKNTEKDKETEQSSLSNKDYFLSLIEGMLGDEGVKNLAIKTILPGLNANIAQMVNEMHLNFHIRFDDKFNCIINHLGEEINPKTLSTGERKKADFIIIIALIKLLKLRFPSLNLLFLDEIFSSVDHDGVYNILKILRSVIKEYNLNTFVINHTVLPMELFDKKIDIYKENGFSKFEIENIK
jgi:DNA repair exonuclease SbcCD ATPase subunit